jgi:hypothetical protein
VLAAEPEQRTREQPVRDDPRRFDLQREQVRVRGGELALLEIDEGAHQRGELVSRGVEELDRGFDRALIGGDHRLIDLRDREVIRVFEERSGLGQIASHQRRPRPQPAHPAIVGMGLRGGVEHRLDRGHLLGLRHPRQLERDLADRPRAISRRAWLDRLEHALVRQRDAVDQR